MDCTSCWLQQICSYPEQAFRLDAVILCVDLAALLMLNEQQLYLFGQLQTSQTGGQLYSYTSPFSECSLLQ